MVREPPLHHASTQLADIVLFVVFSLGACCVACFGDTIATSEAEESEGFWAIGVDSASIFVEQSEAIAATGLSARARLAEEEGGFFVVIDIKGGLFVEGVELFASGDGAQEAGLLEVFVSGGVVA